MRILYLAQYFPPEIGASQIRAIEMCRGLVAAGHDLTVIAEVPNHPTGIIPPDYKGALFRRSAEEGFEVIRVWVKPATVRNFRSRITFYASYMVTAALAGLLLARGKYDLIFATSPPLFGGWAGLAISYLRRTPFIFEIIDLWPQAAISFRELQNPRYIKWATWMEERCYSRARKIVVTAQEMADNLTGRGIPAQKIMLIRNGSNTELFGPDKEAGEQIRAQLGLQDKFVVIYAGLHGIAYDLPGLMDVANSLKDNEDIHFLLVGDGPVKAETEKRATEHGLTNVTFIPQIPTEQIPAYYNAADVSVVPMRTPQAPGTLPIKIYDSMACALPVIVCANGEPRQVVEEAQSGLVTDPMNLEQLEQAILKLHDNPELRTSLGQNALAAVRSNYSRQAQAKQLTALLESVVSQG